MRNRLLSLLVLLGIFTAMSFDKPESIKDLWQRVDYNLQSARPVKASKILDKIIEISKKQGLTVDLIKAYGYKRKVSRWFDNPNDSLARFMRRNLRLQQSLFRTFCISILRKFMQVLFRSINLQFGSMIHLPKKCVFGAYGGLPIRFSFTQSLFMVRLMN